MLQKVFFFLGGCPSRDFEQIAEFGGAMDWLGAFKTGCGHSNNDCSLSFGEWWMMHWPRSVPAFNQDRLL